MKRKEAQDLRIMRLARVIVMLIALGAAMGEYAVSRPPRRPDEDPHSEVDNEMSNIGFEKVSQAQVQEEVDKLSPGLKQQLSVAIDAISAAISQSEEQV